MKKSIISLLFFGGLCFFANDVEAIDPTTPETSYYNTIDDDCCENGGSVCAIVTDR